ncbi:MAG: hypothetical protein AB7E24_23310 [Novosphingobium sp.]
MGISTAFRSVFNLHIEFFPQIERSGAIEDLTGDKLVGALATATKPFETLEFATVEEGNSAIELAKSSLEEAKKQTEYQDDKASRLLTVTSFVGALSGVLLASFLDRYPLDKVPPLTSEQGLTLAAGYFAFLLFTLFALFGGVVTFHATRTRFKYSKKPQATDPDKPAKSMLFYQEIIAVSPQGWADSFVTVDQAGTPALRDGLQEAYFRNYVMEAYLIAAKTADKLRYLGPAQGALAWALRFLLLFVLLFAFAVAHIPETKGAPDPVKVDLHSVATAFPVRLVAEPDAKVPPVALPSAGAKP